MAKRALRWREGNLKIVQPINTFVISRQHGREKFPRKWRRRETQTNSKRLEWKMKYLSEGNIRIEDAPHKSAKSISR